MASDDGEFQSHSEIVQRFVSMRDGVGALWNKINELRNEVSEHEQVLKALEPMDPSRRCYRLVGEVLVEGTVGEAIPDIKQREQGLEAVTSTHSIAPDLSHAYLGPGKARRAIRERSRCARSFSEEVQDSCESEFFCAREGFL